MDVTLTRCSARHLAAKSDAPAAINEINLNVSRGEHVGIIGPSGAGKTSLLYVIACALKPTQGAVQLGATDPWTIPQSGLRAMRKRIFFAPQVPPLPPRQRVVTAVLAGRLPQMGFWSALRSLFFPTQIAAAHAALMPFDLSEKMFERVDRLSGGERQRVGLARGLASNAELFLIDEPLSALDPTRATQAINTLTRTARERGATLIATLHQVETALQHFPRIIGMREGKIAFDIPAAQVSRAQLEALYANHLHELTQPAADSESITTAAPAAMYCR